MIATVYPSSIKGKLLVPSSKSAMQRALAAALIRKGRSVLHNPGTSADDMAALRCIRALGAKVSLEADRWLIESQGIRPTESLLDCGESGLSIRMFTPIAALSNLPMRITGTGSLVNRPMRFFEEVFPQLGVEVKLHEGCLPIDINGPLRPSSIQIDGSLSSQFLTGLLMAYAAASAEHVTIEVSDLKSRPYVDLTLQILQKFGLAVPVNKDYRQFIFSDGNPSYNPSTIEYSVEADWSGGAFWFSAAAISGSIELMGLDPHSTQADRAIENLLLHKKEARQDDSVFRIEQNLPDPFEFDATDCPDLFPPLVALAAHLSGVSVIRGAHRLVHKESNRAVVLKMEFEKLGVRIDLEEDIMKVYGGSGLRGGHVEAHGDHRIAMALGVAALGAEGPVHIADAGCVQKSYPGFWSDLQSMGASLTLTT